MDTSLSPPLTIIALGGVVVALALLILATRLRRWKRIALVLTGVLIFIPSALMVTALNVWIIDSRFRTYRSFYYDIEVGMERAKVMELIEKHYPAGGPRERPTIMDDTSDSLGFFMNPEDSKEPNCEGIFLSLHQGKVTSKGYSPD